MASRSRGLLWTDKEISIMLNALYRLRAGRKVMTSTNVETSSVFQKVSEILKERGYDRNFSQIRSKFKKEKGFFYDSMEDYGGLPPRPVWGPRFHLFVRLWEQADRPDFRQRRPATSGKAKKRNREMSPGSDVVEASSSLEPECSNVSVAVQANLDSSSGERESHGTPREDIPVANAGENEDSCIGNEDAHFLLVEGREPTYSELVEKVFNMQQEICRVKRTCEFMRQGFLRIKYEWDQHRIAEALRQQREETDSEEEEEEDSVQKNNDAISDDEAEIAEYQAEVLEIINDTENEVLRVDETNGGHRAQHGKEDVVNVLDAIFNVERTEDNCD